MKTREFEGNLIQTFCSLKISATLLMKRKKKKIRIHLPCAGKRGGQTVLCRINPFINGSRQVQFKEERRKL
jgi:hypothetical protein